MNVQIKPAMPVMRMLTASILLGITHAAVTMVTKGMDSYVKVRGFKITPKFFRGDNYMCADINECANQTSSGCHENADCIDAAGNYTCSCRNGYQGNGFICEGKIAAKMY